MNCDRAKQLLVDLVYGELDGAEARAVEQHAAACAACGEELEKLRLARSLLARHRGGEPRVAPVLPAARPYIRVRRFVTAAMATAAAVLVGVIVWTLHETATPPVYGQVGPPVITRTGVSLTIMSKPDNWPGPFRWGDEQQPAQGRRSQSYQVGGQVDAQITFSNSPVQSLIRPYTWPGMALVRDQRLVRNLRKGLTDVRFTGVPSGILPDTVRLRGLDHPDGLTILEQNYQYDLASAAAVLHRHIDERITVVFRTGETAGGLLMSFDGRALVIRTPGGDIRNIDRSQVRSVAFEKLPAGLLTRPTLVWKLENRAAARQQFEVAYLTHGLNWRADYVLKLKPAVKPEVRTPKSEIVDTADLVGYATVTNLSGVTYEDAQLKLMAGDVNLILPKWALGRYHWRYAGFYGDSKIRLGEFREKSFFEYHLYTLGRLTTIRNAETKQIELVSGSGLKLRRGYVYDPHRGHKTAVRVVSQFKNSEENGLGKPLPKGVIRLYAPDGEGVQTYVAKTNIDHTPKDEKIRLRWGHAFDIVGAFKQTHYRRNGYDRHCTWQYQLRNHKDYGVTVTVIAHVPRSTYKADCNWPWHVREVGLVEIDVPVKADSAATVTFSHSYNNRSGGGLKSPHDTKEQ